MTELPIACTLSADGLAERAREFAELPLRSRDRDGNTLELRYDAIAEDQVRSLAERERECCAFLTIDVENDGNQVLLRITAPPEAAEVLDFFANTPT